VERYKWDWPSIYDLRRVRARALGAEYQPYVVVVDAEGRVVARHAGAGTDAIWEALAAKLP
jgi:hypothetical protein